MRDKFECEYVRRHMANEPYLQSKLDIENLRNGDTYDDEHLRDCWYFFNLSRKFNLLDKNNA